MLIEPLLEEFLVKKQMSNDGKYWFMKKENKLYIKAVNHKRNKLRLPQSLVEEAGENLIEEIGPDGRILHYNNMEINL